MEPELDQIDHEASPKPLRRLVIITLAVLVLVGAGLAIWAITRPSSSSAPSGPEGVPLSRAPDLAPATTTLDGQPVGPITCVTESEEHVKYHIHSYVSFYVQGQARRLPAGLGITQPWLVEKFPSGVFYDVGPRNCLYWIHTHTNDDIVHVEAPAKGTFTLGQLFAIWNQPLSSSQVGPATGPVVVFVNGKRYRGDISSVPLVDHGTIQIDIGSPVVPFQAKTFEVTGLCGQGTTSCTSKK
jgi:hypothetical protein